MCNIYSKYGFLVKDDSTFLSSPALRTTVILAGSGVRSTPAPNLPDVGKGDGAAYGAGLGGGGGGGGRRTAFSAACCGAAADPGAGGAFVAGLIGGSAVAPNAGGAALPEGS